MVPNQKASTSSREMPAESTHSTVASVRRSSTLLSHSSPKGVQPIPTIATRSRIPLLAMSASLCSTRVNRPGVLVRCSGTVGQGPSLPEVIMYPFGGIEAPKGHLDPGTDGHRLGVDVSHLSPISTAAVEVDHRSEHGRRKAVRQPIDGVSGHRAPHVGQPQRLHPVDGPARQADPGGRKVDKTARHTTTGTEAELPTLVPSHGGSIGPFGIGAARGLTAEVSPPGEEHRIREVGATLVRQCRDTDRARLPPLLLYLDH